MFSKYVAKFPNGYSPSDAQVSLLKEIEKAYNDGYKYVIVQAPTGTGKSFIPVSYTHLTLPTTPYV